jgi:hypothetical protein
MSSPQAIRPFISLGHNYILLSFTRVVEEPALILILFFKLCSKLQEFAYHVGFPQLEPPHLLQPSELKTVCIQIESIDHLTALSGEQYEMDDGVDLSWTILYKVFAFFSAYAFPALWLIILHGDWDSVVHDGQFHPLRQLVLDRGCSLEYPDGTPVW